MLHESDLPIYRQILTYSREQEQALLADDLEGFANLSKRRGCLQQELLEYSAEEASRFPEELRAMLIALLQQTIQQDEVNKRLAVAGLKTTAGHIRNLELQRQYLATCAETLRHDQPGLFDAAG